MIGTAVGALCGRHVDGRFPARSQRLSLYDGGVGLCLHLPLDPPAQLPAYAAVLAGYTLIIVVSTSIATPDQVFEVAIRRTSEICVGIVCATLVVALTDLGDSPRRLSALLSQLITETAGHLADVLAKGAAGMRKVPRCGAP